MTSWWLIVLMFLLLVLPIGYGWGYRGWGVPYPTFIQRRRGKQGAAAVTGGSPDLDHQSWGWRGDFVWGVLLVGLLWACSSLWWR